MISVTIIVVLRPTVGKLAPGRGVRARGFTLVELLFVVALIGVLTALAFGAMSTSSYAGTVEGFGDEISNTLETARMRAMSTRKWQRIEFDTTTVTVWQSDTTGMGPVNTWEKLEVISAPGNVQVAATDTATHVALAASVPSAGSGVPGAVDYAPDGSAQAFTVFLEAPRDGTHNRVIVYRATGATYVLKDW